MTIFQILPNNNNWQNQIIIDHYYKKYKFKQKKKWNLVLKRVMKIVYFKFDSVFSLLYIGRVSKINFKFGSFYN